VTSPRGYAVLVRAGVLRPGRPDVLARTGLRLWRYGPTLAGGYAVAAARVPDRLAVADQSASRTFAELDRRVRLLAAGLAERGIGPGTSVALLAHNSVAFVEALVAVSRVGADALLLSTFLSAEQTANLLAGQRPRLAVADPELLPLLAGGDVPVVTTDALDQLAGVADPSPSGTSTRTWRPVARGRLVVLTSGTTGTPKGARRPVLRGLGAAASVLSRLRLQFGDRMMIASPLFHTWGLAMLQLAPALGAGVVLRRRADAEVVLDAVAGERCTVLIAVPVILDRMARLERAVRDGYDRQGLRMIASSGSALTAECAVRVREAFGDVLYNVYGSTENSWVTIADPADLREAPGTAGRPPIGTAVTVLDADGRPVPPSTVGRIFVHNDVPFDGYTDGSDRPRHGGLMATGDLGFLDPAGRLTVVGRDDDLVISGAEKVYPLEVEQVISTLPAVREVAVIGIPDADLGQRLVAYVAGEPGLTAADVQDHVRGHLARFAVPKEVVFVDALPRTPTGKVVRRLLTSPPGPSPDTGSGLPCSAC